MKVFLDTSSLIKLYHYESGTDELDKLFTNYNVNEFYLSEISKVEFNSAIWKKVRTKEITVDEANHLINLFMLDYKNYNFINLNSFIILESTEILNKYAFKGLRTLDSIQLTSVIHVKNEITFAVTSDNLLESFMESEGIKVI